jgi:Putative zinc ribbon domain
LSLATECESCGRPMGSNMDHGAQNPDNPYCVHCTDLKGKLLPFERIYESLVNTAMQTRWMNKEQAERFAFEEMGKWPAWKDKVADMPKPKSWDVSSKKQSSISGS